jgi:hypothetical protein
MTPDLLEHVHVTVPCNVCDESYTVPASVVRTSQQLLADGCSGTSSFECDAAFYATLIDHDAIESLEHVWAQFCRSAGTHGGLGVTVERDDATGARRADEDSRPPARRADEDRRPLEVWENEGGRCAQPPRR